MSHEVFYVPSAAVGEVVLDAGESMHAVKVLRMKEGEAVVVVDGRGHRFTGEISDAHPRQCRVLLKEEEKEVGNRNYRLHVAMAPTKNSERTDWFVEKATEIGIDIITPLICHHSERRRTNRERLQKMGIAAMKQSQKSRLPDIWEDTPFDLMTALPFDGIKCIAHCHRGDMPHLKEVVVPGKAVMVLIGPEGDFSPEEVSRAVAAGFREVTLGTSRLRTETAALVACLTVSLINA